MSKTDFQNGFAIGFSTGAGAGEAGNVSVQPDYLQNDSNAKDYIKNRPFYSLLEEKTIAFTSSPAFSQVESVGLIEGEVYNCYLSEPSGQDPNIQLTAINVYSLLGIQAPALAYPNFDEPAYAIIDKVSINEGEFESDDNSAIVIAMSNFWVNGLFGEIKKIDNIYLPKFKLPIATKHIVGGVTAPPIKETTGATQPVYINPDTGRLYTKPGKEYSTARLGTPGLLYIPVEKGISLVSGYHPIAMHQLTGELYSQADKIVYQYTRSSRTIDNYDGRPPREVSVTKELNGSKYAAALKITVWTHERENGLERTYSLAPEGYSYADILEGGFPHADNSFETFTKIIYDIVDGNVYEDAFITAQPEKITGSNTRDQLEGFSTTLFIISSDEEAIDTLVSNLNNHHLIKTSNIRIYFQTSNENYREGDVI